MREVGVNLGDLDLVLRWDKWDRSKGFSYSRVRWFSFDLVFFGESRGIKERLYYQFLGFLLRVVDKKERCSFFLERKVERGDLEVQSLVLEVSCVVLLIVVLFLQVFEQRGCIRIGYIDDVFFFIFFSCLFLYLLQNLKII